MTVVAVRRRQEPDPGSRSADVGNWTPSELNPHREGMADHAARGADYGAAMGALLDEPWFAGWHWCGYVENTGGRGWGLKDPWDEPYRPLTDAITEHNRRAAAYRKEN